MMAPHEIDQFLPGFALSVRGQDGYTIVAISGELDIASVPVLRERLLGLLRPHASRIVIDLSGVTLCDESGLAMWAGASRRAGQLDGIRRLAAPGPWWPSFSGSLALTRGSRSSPPCRRPSAHPLTRSPGGRRSGCAEATSLLVGSARDRRVARDNRGGRSRQTMRICARPRLWLVPQDLRDGIRQRCAGRLLPATAWSLRRGRARRRCSWAGP